MGCLSAAVYWPGALARLYSKAETPLPAWPFAGCVALCKAQLASTLGAQSSHDRALGPQRVPGTEAHPCLALAVVALAGSGGELARTGSPAGVARGALAAMARPEDTHGRLSGPGLASDQSGQ